MLVVVGTAVDIADTVGGTAAGTQARLEVALGAALESVVGSAWLQRAETIAPIVPGSAVAAAGLVPEPAAAVAVAVAIVVHRRQD